MALAKKCDRCGNLYEVQNREIRRNPVNGISLITRDEDNSNACRRGYIDLCPQCLKSLDYWLNMKFEPVLAIKDDGIHIGKEYKEEENV